MAKSLPRIDPEEQISQMHGAADLVRHLGRGALSTIAGGLAGLGNFPLGADAMENARHLVTTSLNPGDLSSEGIKTVQDRIAPLYHAVLDNTGPTVRVGGHELQNPTLGQSMDALSAKYHQGVQQDADLVGKYLDPSVAGMVGAVGEAGPNAIFPEGGAERAIAGRLPAGAGEMMNLSHERLLEDGANASTLAREAAARRRMAEEGIEPQPYVEPFQGRQAAHEGAVAARRQPAHTIQMEPASEAQAPWAPQAEYPEGTMAFTARDPETGDLLGRQVVAKRGNTMQSVRMDTRPDMQQQGIGTSLFQRALNHAHENGMDFASDTQISVPAMKTYLKHPGDSFLNSAHEEFHDPVDGPVIRSSNGQPIVSFPRPQDDLEPGQYIASQAHAKGGRIGLSGIGKLVDQFAPLVKSIEDTGGVTYHPGTGAQPKSGYAVSIHKGREAVLPSAPDAHELARYAHANQDLFAADPAAHVGVWHDPESGQHFMDVSHVDPDFNSALQKAQEHQQLGIYDLGRGETIDTTPDSMHFLHMSNLSTPTATLDPSFYGTGIRGAEAKRGGTKVTSLYPADIALSDIEHGLESKTPYRVSTPRSSMYDISADPEGYRSNPISPGSAPDVDWGAKDLLDQGRVNADSVKDTYAGRTGIKGDPVVYKDYLPLSDLQQASGSLSGAPRMSKPTGTRGVFPPIKVALTDDGMSIVDGEHRTQAWGKAGYEHAPAWVMDYRSNAGPASGISDFSSAEDAIKAAGYAGYHVPEGQGIFRGQARLFHPTPATRLGPGAAPEAEEDLSAGFAKGGEVGPILGGIGDLVKKYATEAKSPVVYHGGQKGVDKFNPETKTHWVGPGMNDVATSRPSYFSTNKEIAKSYGPNVTSHILDMKNPYVWDAMGKTYDLLSENAIAPFHHISDAIQGGHDGLIIKNIRDSADMSGPLGDTHITLQPSQISDLGFAEGGEVGTALGGLGALVRRYAPEAEHLAGAVAEHGGVTYNPTSGALHTSGYAVPTQGARSVALDHPPSPDDLHDFMMTHQDAFDEDPQASLHVHGDENGNSYLHVAHVTPDFEHASDVARQHGVPGFQDLGSGEIHGASTTDPRDVPETGSADPDLVQKYLAGPAHVSTPWTPGEQTVANPKRNAFPGVYGDPRQVIADSSAKVGPEDPLLQQLFGVSRSDLSDLALSRQGNELGVLPGAKPNPTGSAAAHDVMTPKNEQRLIDMMAEARKSPELFKGMTGWYTMDPLYERFRQLYGDEEAPSRYAHFNTMIGMASPGSDVGTEIARGTGAHWLNNEGRFNDFLKYAGGMGGDAPADMPDLPGHVYHKPQGLTMKAYLDTGQVQMKPPKVPMYIQASGVPETGFQTETPVGDAHWARGVGLADTRGTRTSKGQEIVPGSSVSTPEMQQLAPWWRDRVAGPAGLESVPAQALAWGAFSPYTGVHSAIGAPKLEILSTQIGKLAQRLGVSPETARDMVISGKAGAFADGGIVDDVLAEGGI